MSQQNADQNSQLHDGSDRSRLLRHGLCGQKEERKGRNRGIDEFEVASEI